MKWIRGGGVFSARGSCDHICLDSPGGGSGGWVFGHWWNKVKVLHSKYYQLNVQQKYHKLKYLKLNKVEKLKCQNMSYFPCCLCMQV